MEEVVFHYFNGDFGIAPNLGLTTHMSGSSCNLRLAASSVFVVFVAESVSLTSLRSLWLCYPYVGVICQNLNSDSWIVNDPCCDSALISPNYPVDLPAEYILERNSSFTKFTLTEPQYTCNKCGLAKRPEKLIFAARQKVDYLQFEKTEEKLARPADGLELTVLDAIFGEGSYLFRNQKYIVHCSGRFKVEGCQGSFDPVFFREAHMAVGAVKMGLLMLDQISYTNYWLLDSMAALFKENTQSISASDIGDRIEMNVIATFLSMALGLTLILAIEWGQSLRLRSYHFRSHIGRILSVLTALSEGAWCFVKLIAAVFMSSLHLESKCFGFCLFLWRILCFVLSTCISAQVVSLLSYARRIDPPNSLVGLGEYMDKTPTRIALSPGVFVKVQNKDKWEIQSDPIIELVLRKRGDPVTDPELIARFVASGKHVAYFERRILESGIHHASDVSHLLVLSDFGSVNVMISWAMQKDCSLLRSTNRKLGQMKDMGVISWMFMKRNMRVLLRSSARAKGETKILPSVITLQLLAPVAGTIGLIFEIVLSRLEKTGGVATSTQIDVKLIRKHKSLPEIRLTVNTRRIRNNR